MYELFPTMQFTLTVPQSTNALYLTTAKLGSRRVATKPYKNWSLKSRFALEDQFKREEYKKLPEKTPFAVTISANVDHRRDIDNLAKPTLDVLRKAGVTPDDRYCNRLVVLRVKKMNGLPKGKMLVSVGPLEYD